jgi:putative transposase
LAIFKHFKAPFFLEGSLTGLISKSKTYISAKNMSKTQKIFNRKIAE